MDARRFVEYLRNRSVATGSKWAAAIVSTGEGLLDRNPAGLLESAECLDALNAPFEAARSRALIGEVAAPRRFEHALFGAFDAFVALGAHPWIERTAVIIGRQAPTVQSPLDLLTKAELRVAAAHLPQARRHHPHRTRDPGQRDIPHRSSR